VKKRTAEAKQRGSHVVEYGTMALGKDPLSLYLGSNPSTSVPSGYQSPVALSIVEQHDADILYLREKVCPMISYLLHFSICTLDFVPPWKKNALKNISQ